jgi:hypothetical protein
VALAAGLLGIVLATATGSGLLYVIATVIAGAGFGVAFLGALRALSSAIPAEHRSSVMSAFYVVAYSSLSVPAIVAGVLTTPLGLNATFEIFGSVIAGVALLVAALAWRTRPRTGLRRELRFWEAIALSIAIMAPTAAMALNGTAPAALIGRGRPLAFIGWWLGSGWRSGWPSCSRRRSSLAGSGRR